MPTIFSKIVAGEIPCYKVAENEDFLAFLDVNPLCEGHTLVIPKAATDYIFDIEDSKLAAFHLFAKQVAKAVKVAIPCKRIGLAVVGLEVPHAHIHLVPINMIGDLNFEKNRAQFSVEQYADIAERIRKAF